MLGRVVIESFAKKLVIRHGEDHLLLEGLVAQSHVSLLLRRRLLL